MHLARLTLDAVGLAAQVALVAWLILVASVLLAHIWILCGGKMPAQITRIERNAEALALEPWYCGKRLSFHFASLFNSVFNR
jgi:hypothetical protein